METIFCHKKQDAALNKTPHAVEISVIIVNYNTSELLCRCLDSIARQTGVSSETIVVDNASSDDSRVMIRKNFPWVKLIPNENNQGFARANNQALDLYTGQYVFFLNPDTEVKPGAFRQMIRFMQEHARVGLAGTRLLYPDGSPQSSVERHYPGQKHLKGAFDSLAGDIAWVLGASMIVRQEIIQALNGFDDEFFLYAEDIDLCLRVRKAGWTVGFISEAVVVHWCGQSERKTPPLHVWEKKFDAEIKFYRKHYPAAAVRAIGRDNVLQACWRILTLKLELMVAGDKEIARRKLEKYQLALKTFRAL